MPVYRSDSSSVYLYTARPVGAQTTTSPDLRENLIDELWRLAHRPSKGGNAVPTLYARAMRRAADIVGVGALATRLGVSQRQLELWMRGLAEPPAEIFLKVADILGEKTVEDLHPSGPTDPGAERGKA